jgi:hypothetical protein
MKRLVSAGAQRIIGLAQAFQNMICVPAAGSVALCEQHIPMVATYPKIYFS